MERLPQPESLIAPTLRRPEEWQMALADPELAQRLGDLVDHTMNVVNATEHPWAADRQAVTFRWQHLVDALGSSASSHCHPLFESERGGSWSDREYANEVLSRFDFRQGKRSFVENALVLTHSLTLEQGKLSLDGLAVTFSTVSNKRSEEEYGDEMVDVFDLRDMAEPISLMADITLEDFALMSDEKRQSLADRINEVQTAERFGRGGGFWPTPQKSTSSDDARTFGDYQKMLEFGTTDRGEIENQLVARKAQWVAEQRTQNPDFGTPPENYDQLDEQLQEWVDMFFDYFAEMRDNFEAPYVNTYNLQYMEFTDEDLGRLLEATIFVHCADEAFTAPDGTHQEVYRLSQPYYEWWVSEQFSEDEET